MKSFVDHHRHGFHEWFGAPNCHFAYEKKWRPGPNIPVYRYRSILVGRIIWSHLLFQGRHHARSLLRRVWDWHTERVGQLQPATAGRGSSVHLKCLWVTAILPLLGSRLNPRTLVFIACLPRFEFQVSHTSWRIFPTVTTTRASHYGDAMRELDDAIGQILERVRQQSSTRATLVLFTSDNGADLNARERAGGGSGMLRKHSIGVFLRIKWTPTLWQADNLWRRWGRHFPTLHPVSGMRAPTIAWWSDQRIGKVERRASSHMDILPTLAHLAGAALPPHLVLDGVRLSSSIQNNLPYFRWTLPPWCWWMAMLAVSRIGRSSSTGETCSMLSGWTLTRFHFPHAIYILVYKNMILISLGPTCFKAHFHFDKRSTKLPKCFQAHLFTVTKMFSGTLLHLDNWWKGAESWDQPLPIGGRPKCDHDRHQGPFGPSDIICFSWYLILIPDPNPI